MHALILLLAAFQPATIQPVVTCTPAGGPPPPGRLELRCMTLRQLIRAAYGSKGQDLAAILQEVVGGPAWLDTQRYDVSTAGATLPALLEQRFHLKVHKEPRETQVYALTVAPQGPKLKPARPGGCVPYSPGTMSVSEPQPTYCGIPRTSFEAGIYTMDIRGETMQHFADRIVGDLAGGRAIDKTGLTGQYDIRLSYARGDTGKEIFTALPEQLGLTLRPEKFPYEVIVVDSAAPLGAQLPPRPTFEVATIKLTPNCDPTGGGPVPGRLELRCTTLRRLIRAAYGAFEGKGIATRVNLDVVGGPGWLDSDRYDISAKAQGAPPVAQMMGPMLQTLLEDRFQVKVHREPRETPVYALTVAKATPKLKPAAPGGCVPLDLLKPPKPGEPEPAYCGFPRTGFQAGVSTIDVSGATMEEFAARGNLAAAAGRPVVDKTGLSGRYDIHLEFSRDLEGAAPSIFTALQEQLGLKLVPDKAAIDVIVVDSARKPTEN